MANAGKEVTFDKDPMAEIRSGYAQGNLNLDAESPESEEEPLRRGEEVKFDDDTSLLAGTELAGVKSGSKPEIVSETDVEVLFARDASGKKIPIKVDFRDREAIKKQILKAAGMDKFRLERDAERKRASELESKVQELSTNWGELDKVYKEGGAKGLFARLGGDGAWEKAVEAELQHREYLAGLSPEEKMQLHMQQKEKQFALEKSSIEERHKKLLDDVERERHTATERELQSRLTPAFEKHRLRGKFGDAAVEDALDKSLWDQVMERLGKYPEDMDLTPSLIEKEFRTAATTYKQFINKQGDSRAQASLEKQKETAAKKAEFTVKKGVASNSIDKQMDEAMKKGDWSSILRQAFKR